MSNAFFQRLLESVSPSGLEREVINVVRDELEGIGEPSEDCMGNLFIKIGNGTKAPVVVMAHGDEVGFQVCHLHDAGFISLRRLGRLDTHTMPGSEIVILSENKRIFGVLGKLPPHVQPDTDRDRILQDEDLWLDIGAGNKSEAERWVRIGDYATVRPNYHAFEGGRRFYSKGLDNKISVFALSEAIKRIPQGMECKHPIVAAITTQEEIGGRGAIACVSRFNPAAVLVIDVGIASDFPSMNKHEFGDLALGKGPGFSQNADNCPGLVKYSKRISQENGIHFQESIGFRPTGGTEAGKIRQLCGGIPVMTVSIPIRNLHSAVEIGDWIDVEQTISFLEKVLLALSAEENIPQSPW